MIDRIRQSLIGGGLGLASALILWTITTASWSFLTPVVDGYEARSYDRRFQAKVAGAGEESIDTVIIVDIDVGSIEELGNYFRWYHDKHGRMLDYLAEGGVRAVLFDVIFDPEPDVNYDTAFVAATTRMGAVYHAFNLAPADSLNFRYPMEAPPGGFLFHKTSSGQSMADIARLYFGDPAAADYLRGISAGILQGAQEPATGQVILVPSTLDVERLALELPADQAQHLPGGDIFDANFVGLLNASRGIGSVEIPQDPDGIIRRAPTAVHFSSAGQVYPSLTMAAIMDMLDIPRDGLSYDRENNRLRLTNRSGEVVRDVPTDDEGRVWVNYHGTFRTFKYISYAWLNRDMLDPAYFKGKTVLVGSTAPGLMDLRSTPVQESYPGVEVHANVLMSFLENEFVQPVSAATSFMLLLLLAALLGGALISLKALVGLVVTIVVAGSWILFAYDQFLGGLVVYEMVRPMITMGGTFLSVTMYQYLVLDKDKRFLKKTFSTYISPDLIASMIEDGVEPELGGESGVHTAFFTDIQSFSGFSELLTAARLVELLNEYLTGMTDILLANGGTLDKYEGDAIISFFGAPVPMEDHATRAIDTALGMQVELAGLRDKWTREGDKWPDLVKIMRMRVGINSGEFVTGNMGSATRMNYTMMGDIVNTAARLEASAKQYGIYIQITRATLELGGPELFDWRDIDKVLVMGKSQAVETVEIMGRKGSLSPQLSQMCGLYQEGMELYRKQEWDQAKALFTQSEALEEVFEKRPGNPSKVYMERCDHFKANPPGDDWDGAWRLTAK